MNNGCGEHNFASRLSCRKCHVIKSDILSQTLDTRNTTQSGLQNDVLHSTNVSSSSSFTGNPVVNNQNEDNSCVVCLDKPKTCVLLKCKHMCVCDVCGYALDKCPICRQQFNPDTDILKVFTC